MEKKKNSFWGDITWKLFIWKLKLSLAWLETKRWKMRTNYCNKGFHKMQHGYNGRCGPDTNNRWKHVHYLKCQYCNYLFFASKSHKKKYLDMTARERSAFRDLLFRAKPSNIICGSRESKEDASASS